jgi:aldose sugar dehydrogenase
VYWSYSEAGEGGSGTAVARGRLDGNRLADVQVIFRQQPKTSGGLHFGSRLVFGRDGKLFVGLGDRFHRKDDAQTLDSHLGKVVRLERDGQAAADNPFVNRAGALKEIWSYGHRNIQGAALHPQTGALWATEHGPQGGDELNVVNAGRNHGWPVITYGRNYGIGTRIGEGTTRNDIPAPLRHWVPTSIAPSGMAFLTSDRYTGWKGQQLFIGALREKKLLRLELDGTQVVKEEALLTDLDERIRDVRQGPDGWLYVLTDSRDGKLIRLER